MALVTAASWAVPSLAAEETEEAGEAAGRDGDDDVNDTRGVAAAASAGRASPFACAGAGAALGLGGVSSTTDCGAAPSSAGVPAGACS